MRPIGAGEVIVRAAPRVLVVDDDESVREVLRRLLGRHATEPSLASSAREAILRLEAEAFGAVISDNDLGPGRSGRWLLEEVGRRWPSTRRVLMSSEPPPALGSDVVFVPKPFGVEQILHALDLPTRRGGSLPKT